MLLDTKSQLARLLATENIYVQERRASTASFNLKTRVLILPILKKGTTPAIYDLFTGHEVGHALFTPLEGYHDSQVVLKVPRSIINIVEDCRIEKLIKRQYPGLKYSFIVGYKELMERNFFKTRGVDLNTLGFLDRINLYFKCGASTGIQFNALEKPLIEEIEKLETFADVLRVSLLIKEHIRKYQNKKIKQDRPSAGPESKNGNPMPDQDSDTYPDEDGGQIGNSDDIDLDDPDGETLPDPDNSSPSKSNDDDGEPQESNKDDKKAEESEEPETNADGTGPTNENAPVIEGGKGTSNSIPDEEPDYSSKTDDAFKDSEKDLIDREESWAPTDYHYGNIPEKPIFENIITHYKKIIKDFKKPRYATYSDGFLEPNDYKKFTKFKRDANPVVSYMFKEFEMRKNAEQLKRTTIAKTGELNTAKLYSYRFNDDIFKRISIVPNGQSHGMLLFIDWSGSMSQCLGSTIKQLLNLVMFCKKANIPYEVYAFTTGSEYTRLQLCSYEKDDISLDSFVLLNFLSSKMSAGEFNYMANVLLKIATSKNKRQSMPPNYGLGGTPLNSTIITAMELIPKYRKENKLQIVNAVFLTDGESDHLSFPKLPQEERYSSKSWIHGFIHKSSGYSMHSDGLGERNDTNKLLEMLRRVTGAHVLGFYLIQSSHLGYQYSTLFPDGTDFNGDMAKFAKEGSLISKASGYDEHYIMMSDKRLDGPDMFDDDNKTAKTTEELVEAFTEYSMNKTYNRTLLSKFIGFIS